MFVHVGQGDTLLWGWRSGPVKDIKVGGGALGELQNIIPEETSLSRNETWDGVTKQNM